MTIRDAETYAYAKWAVDARTDSREKLTAEFRQRLIAIAPA